MLLALSNILGYMNGSGGAAGGSKYHRMEIMDITF